MSRADRFRAYAPPAMVLIAAITLIITQALGVPANLTERIAWLSAVVLITMAWAYQTSMARAYTRLYHSIMDTYEKCAENRDYWMNRAQARDLASLGGEISPGKSCIRCGQPSVPATGDCRHGVCGWCAWCPACMGPYAIGPGPEVIP